MTGGEQLHKILISYYAELSTHPTASFFHALFFLFCMDGFGKRWTVERLPPFRLPFEYHSFCFLLFSCIRLCNWEGQDIRVPAEAQFVPEYYAFIGA